MGIEAVAYRKQQRRREVMSRLVKSWGCYDGEVHLPSDAEGWRTPVFSTRVLTAWLLSKPSEALVRHDLPLARRWMVCLSFLFDVARTGALRCSELPSLCLEEDILAIERDCCM